MRDGTSFAFSYPNFAASDYFFRTTNDVGDGVFRNAHRPRFELSEGPPPPALLLLATALGGMAVIGDRRLKAQV